MFKKIILSVVAIAMLSSSAFAGCPAQPNWEEYLSETVKEYNIKRDDGYENAILLAKSEGAAATFTKKFGGISISKTKSIGVGVSSTISYKQIFLNYSRFLGSLNNEDLGKLVAFYSAYPAKPIFDKFKNDVNKEDEYGYPLLAGYQFLTLKEMAKNSGEFLYFDEGEFIYRFILEKTNEEKDVLKDKQLNTFIKAIIEGDRNTALKTIRAGRIHYPSFVKTDKEYYENFKDIEAFLLRFECKYYEN